MMASVDRIFREHLVSPTAGNLQFFLNEFAAEFLRVLAGGGKPDRILSMMADCTLCVIDFHKENGCGPDVDFVRRLFDAERVERERHGDKGRHTAESYDPNNPEYFQRVEVEIRQSALRLIAEQFDGNRALESRRRTAMKGSLREWSEAYAARRGGARYA